MITIKVEISPTDGTCRHCNLLIFDDFGPPYCAAGFSVKDNGSGFPKRPQQCLDAEIAETARSQRLQYLEAQIVELRKGSCHAAHPGEITFECDLNNKCPNCRLRTLEMQLRCKYACPHGEQCTLNAGHSGGHNHRDCTCNEPDIEVK